LVEIFPIALEGSVMQEHTFKAFDTDIEGMRGAVIAMGGLVEKQFARAVDAVRHADLRLVSQVLIDEDTVNSQHIQADLLCNHFLARRQPFAIDLREVLASIHAINDLERIGDEAKKIALKARDIGDMGARFTLPLAAVQEMADSVRVMLELALNAFVRHDASMAERLESSDAEVDARRDALRQQLMEHAARHSEAVTACVDLIFVVQSIERVGDHAKNIAEYVVTVVEGIDRRHGSRTPAVAVPVTSQD
jgi:phosphate transport system protein